MKPGSHRPSRDLLSEVRRNIRISVSGSGLSRGAGEIEAAKAPDHGLEGHGLAGLGVGDVDAKGQASAQEELLVAAALEAP